MLAWIENLITGATSRVMISRKSSPEQVELNHVSNKFRRRFNQMQDRLKAPAPPGEISRISNLAPSDNRRQQSLLPSLPPSILIMGAVIVGVVVAVDLALVINAGGIPGVFNITNTPSVVKKVSAVATKGQLQEGEKGSRNILG